MKRTRVVVPWPEGLHLRAVANLARSTGSLRSSIWLKIGERSADVRSILSVLMLAASMGAVLEVEAVGDDEDHAIKTVELVFSTMEDTGDGTTTKFS
jgi:phosphocarrier protein HPr